MKTQSCNDGTPIRKGDSFCFCSGIKEVPVSPDVSNDWRKLPKILKGFLAKFENIFLCLFILIKVDAEVYWKILKIPGSSPPTSCEIEWNVNNLKKNQNKSTLMCIQLPTKVKNDKPRVFKSEKSAIQGLLNGWKN